MAKRASSRTAKKTVSKSKGQSFSSAMRASAARPSSEPMQMSLGQLMAVYASWLVVHVVLVYAAAMLFPNMIVLGTHLISPMVGLVYSMAVFTLLTVGSIPVLEGVSGALSMKLKDMHWMVLYMFINFAGLWLVARFAEQLGMGLASWTVAAALALVFNVAQGLTIKTVVQKFK